MAPEMAPNVAFGEKRKVETVVDCYNISDDFRKEQ